MSHQDLFGESGPIITGHVTTGGIIITELNTNRGVVTDTNQELVSLAELKDGYIMVGKTGDQPQAAAVASTVNIIVTAGPGTLSFDTVQDISTAASPTFQTVTCDTLTANNLDISGSITLAGNLEVDNILVNNGASVIGTLAVGGNITTSGTVDGVDLSTFKSDYDAKVNQDVRTTASPTFVGLTLSAPLVTSSTVDTRDISADGAVLDAHVANVSNPHSVTKAQVGLSNVDNKSEATMFANSTFTGTTTVADLIDSALTATRLLSSDATKKLQSVTISNANGTNVSFSGSTLACTNTQDLQSSASPTFASVNLSNTTNQLSVGSGGNITTLNFPASAGAVTLNFPNTSQDIVDRTSVQTLTNKTLSGAIISTAGISLDDTDSAYELKIQSTSGLTANRSLTLHVEDSDRSIEMGGNLYISNDFEANGTMTLETAGTCHATIPTGINTLATLALNQSFTGVKTFTTAPVIATITNAAATLTLPTSTATLSGIGLAETFSGVKTYSANFQPSANNTIDVGTTALRWKDIYQAGRLVNNGPIHIGDSSGGTNTGGNSLFIGVSSGANVLTGTIGAQNTVLGTRAGQGETTSTYAQTTAIGYQALLEVTTGQQNTACGASALSLLTTGSRCTALGYNAGVDGSGSDSTFVGYNSGAEHASSSACTYVGSSSGVGTGAGASGVQNVAVGNSALGNGVLTTGNQNTCLGVRAGDAITSAANNIAIGWRANSSSASVGVGLTTGTDNIVIGADASLSSNSAINRIVIGKGALNSTNNSTVLGNASCTTCRINGTTTINGNLTFDADNTRTVGDVSAMASTVYGYAGSFVNTMETKQLVMNNAVTASATPYMYWNAQTYRKFVVSRAITAAEFKSLNTTPIAILNTQGASMVIVAKFAAVRIVFNTTAMVGAGTIGLQVGTAGMTWGGGIVPNALATSTVSALSTWHAPQTSSVSAANNTDKPLNIVATTNFTTGDTTMHWYCELIAMLF